VACGLLALRSPAAAQELNASLGLGASRVEFADEPAFGSTTLSPTITISGARGSLGLGGTLARVDAASWSRQGLLVGSLFSPVSAGGWMLEGNATAGGARFPSGFATGQGLGALRLHRLGTWLSGWAGGAAGAMYDGAAWRRVQQVEVGGTLSGPQSRVTLMLTPAAVDDSLQYTDLLATYGTAFGAVDVSLSLGGRAGATLPIVGGDARVWGSANLNWWVQQRVAVTAGVGTYPVDLAQGFPAGRYVSAGLRLGARRSLTAINHVAARATATAAREAGLSAFSIRSDDADGISVRVRALGATQVEVAGDVTRWAPVRLERSSDGWWWARLPTASGDIVELAVRVDGGPWLTPPGADPVRDEFGGMSGRVTLRGRM
jgi:hypothetical protein